MSTEPTPAITVVAAIIRGEDGRICLSKRPDHKHQGGRWEFPGGKVGERLDEALARELYEELGMASSLSSLYDHCASIPRFARDPAFSGCDRVARVPTGKEGQLPGLSDLADLSFPAANQPVVTAILLPLPLCPILLS